MFSYQITFAPYHKKAMKTLIALSISNRQLDLRGVTAAIGFSSRLYTRHYYNTNIPRLWSLLRKVSNQTKRTIKKAAFIAHHTLAL